MSIDSRVVYTIFIGLVAIERLVELRIAGRNARRAMAEGGRETGRAHYRVMKVLHTTLLVAALLEVWLLDRPFIPWLGWPMLGLVVLTMALRYWVIATLRHRWNTRIIIVPSWEPATGGPYRYFRHPNYLAVIVEVAALPLVHTAWITALVFSIANAWLLTVRIRAEEGALAGWSGYEDAFAGRPRLLPASGDRTHPSASSDPLETP